MINVAHSEFSPDGQMSVEAAKSIGLESIRNLIY